MVCLLLAERVPVDGHVLVLGAGGGLETKAMAEGHPGWRFDGIDPSAEMIRQAEIVLGPQAAKVRFHLGTVEDAPAGPYDGATSLLVLHFLGRDERLRTVRDVVKRLKPGAPFVAVHHSFPKPDANPDRWLRRNAAFLTGSGIPGLRIDEMIAAMQDRLPALAPEEDEALLREAGLADIELFYAALTFKGWIGYKP
nr:class I SAM-dependent methyltransferase [Chthonobacter albigriseus]